MRVDRFSAIAAILCLAAAAGAAPKEMGGVATESVQLTQAAGGPTAPLSLWYGKPAGHWTEALPVGNGHLGAMVYGGVGAERLQLNEDTLWEGYPVDRNNPEALKNLPEIRKLLFEGKEEEATKLIGATMMGNPARIKSYQPLGDLIIEDADTKTATNYRRSLDLSTGVATTTYMVGDTTFIREVFVSRPDDLIVVHLTADKPGKIHVAVKFTRAKDADVHIDPENTNLFVLKGQIQSQYVNQAKKPWGDVKPGMRFESHMLAMPSNGKGILGKNGMNFSDTDSLTLVVAAHSDYNRDGTLDAKADLSGLCEKDLQKIAGKSYESLLAAHTADFQKMMGRMDLTLGQTDPAIKALPTDERLARLDKVKDEAKASDDPDLVATYFQYGRYMLLASSRPGTMPNNLQGIWNEEMNAAWNSDYHTNINIQMNYWPAEITNLAECHEPLFDMMDNLAVAGAKTAKVEYGAGGWVVHHLTDPFLCTTPCDGPQGVWPMGAAWLCQHTWEHYQFSQDKKFLADRAYPLMKGASRFIIDFLVTAPEGTPVAGKLVTSPSHSPENKFIADDGKQSSLTYAATMDLEIIHDLLTHTIEASKILNTDPDFRAECEKALANLAPLQVSKKDGRLQEWVEDYKEQDPHHRHASHLFAVYPGDQITIEGTPDLAAAAKKSLEARTDQGATEWAMAWRSAVWARFHEPERAYALINNLVSHHLYTNLFNAYPPFQIDGNLGATAAIAEMLLQSQSGEMKFLPALPKAWGTGSVKGLRARGNFTVDMTWQDGKLTAATLTSNAGSSVRIRSAAALVITADGKPVAVTKPSAELIEFPTTVGATYQIKP